MGFAALGPRAKGLSQDLCSVLVVFLLCRWKQGPNSYLRCKCVVECSLQASYCRLLIYNLSLEHFQHPARVYSTLLVVELLQAEWDTGKAMKSQSPHLPIVQTPCKTINREMNQKISKAFKSQYNGNASIRNACNRKKKEKTETIQNDEPTYKQHKHL